MRSHHICIFIITLSLLNSCKPVIGENEPIDNDINQPTYPEEPFLYDITLEDSTFILRWQPNMESDFAKYILFESFYDTMDNKSIIYQSNNPFDTVFTQQMLLMRKGIIN